MMSRIKEWIKKNRNSFIVVLICKLYTLLGRNHFHIYRGNKFEYKGNFLSNTIIDVKGYGNRIIITSNGLSVLEKVYIYIRGNNNVIYIADRCNLVSAELWIEDNNGEISIGTHCNICGKTHLAVIEGTKIKIGNGCLFSTDVVFRTGDSHSIMNAQTKKRINPSKNILIGDRVWFGNKAIILKGVKIPNDVIVGTGSIVTKSIEESNAIVVGCPAKVVKTGICWDMQRR